MDPDKYKDDLETPAAQMHIAKSGQGRGPMTEHDRKSGQGVLFHKSLCG